MLGDTGEQTEARTSWNIKSNSGDRHEDRPLTAPLVITRMEMLERGWGPEGGQVYIDGWDNSWTTQKRK